MVNLGGCVYDDPAWEGCEEGRKLQRRVKPMLRRDDVENCEAHEQTIQMLSTQEAQTVSEVALPGGGP